MKKTLREKLKAYSITAGAVAATATSQGQVLYTDVNPDVTISGDGNSYDLDLNNDNNIDFEISVLFTSYTGGFTFSSGFVNYSSMGTGVNIAAMPNNEVRGNWPLALINGAGVQDATYGWYYYGDMPLGGRQEFFSSYSFASYYGGTYAGTNTFTNIQGNFNGQTDRYIGLRIDLGGNTHYGWARVDIVDDSTFTVKDYAIELTPDVSITTGDTGLAQFASPALNVVASDIDDDGNAGDISVQFDQASNEASVLLYRAIVVKETSSAAFTLLDAQNLGSAAALPIVPTGATTYTQTLLSGMEDSDGDLVTVGVPYQVFIHTIKNPNEAINDALSNPSDTVVLEVVPGYGPVQSIGIVDVADNVNGTDLEANFNKLADETGLDEYRIHIVKSAASGTFNLASALANSNFFAVAPNGQNVSTVLNSTSRDSDGDLITDGVPYRAFVVSIADGVAETHDFLSPSSNELTLGAGVGIDALKANENIKITYLNDGVRIASADGTRIKNFEVMTLEGKLVNASVDATSEIELNRSTLASGMYLVRMNDGSQFAKVMIP